MEGYVPGTRTCPIYLCNQHITMMTPSTKHIFLFFALNFLLTSFFNILLFKIPSFLTYESFGKFLINSDKIGMLVSVFILTAFILNFLFFLVFFKSDFKRSLLSIVKMSTGVFLVGVVFAVVISFIKEIQ